MKKQLVVATLAILSLNAQSHAKGLTALSDREMSDSVGQREFNAAAFINGLTENLNTTMRESDDSVAAENIIKQIAVFTSAFGLQIDNLKINGMQFDGTGSLTITNEQGKTITRPFPTYIETMTFDLSAGASGSPRIGQVEVQGLRMQGLNIQVTMTK